MFRMFGFILVEIMLFGLVWFFFFSFLELLFYFLICSDCLPEFCQMCLHFMFSVQIQLGFL